MTIKQALISVSDKTGVLEFAQGLAAQGVKLLSTGGTAKMLRDAGLAVTEIGDYTGFPEMLDGRVKTLHPKVHGGILARRDLAEHMATIEQHGIPTIDLVCVNLYPFAATIAKPGVTLEDAIENIDIGGPAMVRSSAKNYAGVAIVTDPSDYAGLLAEMKAGDGALSLATRFGLARKHTRLNRLNLPCHAHRDRANARFHAGKTAREHRPRHRPGVKGHARRRAHAVHLLAHAPEHLAEQMAGKLVHQPELDLARNIPQRRETPFTLQVAKRPFQKA